MSGSSSLLSFLLGKGETTNPTIPFYFLCSPPHSARFLYPQIKLVGHPQSCEGYPATSCWNSSSWHSKVTKLERFWGYGWVSWPSGTVQCCRLLWFLWGIIMIIRIKQPTFSVIFVWATLEANPCLRPQPHWVLVYSRKWLGVILWAVLLFFKFIGLYQPPKMYHEAHRHAVLISVCCLGILLLRNSYRSCMTSSWQNDDTIIQLNPFGVFQDKEFDCCHNPAAKF